ncbi:RagB/SusD family nutrient uptake outer membrane protein [Compostibacter hankyongensis]|uniref:RagB/SusD family nutrient uptake outer membrane protein n=2 Tax=Compostibacter hankyongensis TaxID=1007089 RepID=A0ABP8FIU1_9BACT
MLLLGVVALPSCNNLLDEEVVSGVTDDFYNTKAGFESAVNAAYVGMRSFYSSERGMTLTVFGTDTYTNGSDGGFKYVNQYTAQLDARYAHVNEVWNDFYVAINTCNAVVDRADTIPDLDEQTKNERVAEARFLRAHYYFILVQLFGPVPLKVHENTKIETEATRAPVKEVYQSIVGDLQYAVKNLPESQPEVGRAARPAAEQLLARVYLTRASSAAAEADDYAHAAEYAGHVIHNYDFQLLDDVGKVFEQGNEHNAESVWTVQYTTDPLYNNDEGVRNDNTSENYASRFFLMQYDVLPGMLRDLKNGTPWKRFTPTPFLLDTLYRDRVNDDRYDKWFTSVWYANNAGSIPQDPATHQPKFKVGDTAIWLPGHEVSDAFIASKPYLVVPPRNYTQKLYPSLNKFDDALRADNQASGVRPFIAFRLAEDYLIAAEALMKTGKTAEAVRYINTLRERAAKPGATPAETGEHKKAMDITAAQLNMDFILDERGRELIGEQFRWFDLVRTHQLLTRVRAYNPDGGPNIKDFHVLRPIPQDQIDRTTNEFPQNEGY